MQEKEAFEILKTYKELVDEVVEESFKKEKELATSLLELLNNWIDLSDLLKLYKDEWFHTLSGSLFVYLWRSYGWIIYEILSGHYFEALKDLRFLFEGAILSLHFEYFIDKKIYEKCKRYGEIGLKVEILELVEDFRRICFSTKDLSKEKYQKSIKKKVRKMIESSSLRAKEKEEYIELYSEILSQPELYWGVGKIIKEFRKEFNLEVGILEKAWSELSGFTHFSSKFLDTILRKPTILWVNDFDEELFKKCVDLQFLTFDLLCTVLAIHFPEIREKIKKILDWWKRNADREFKLIEGVLREID